MLNFRGVVYKVTSHAINVILKCIQIIGPGRFSISHRLCISHKIFNKAKHFKNTEFHLGAMQCWSWLSTDTQLKVMLHTLAANALAAI